MKHTELDVGMGLDATEWHEVTGAELIGGMAGPQQWPRMTGSGPWGPSESVQVLASG